VLVLCLLLLILNVKYFACFMFIPACFVVPYGRPGLVKSSFDILVFINNFCLFGACEFDVSLGVPHCDN